MDRTLGGLVVLALIGGSAAAVGFGGSGGPAPSLVEIETTGGLRPVVALVTDAGTAASGGTAFAVPSGAPDPRMVPLRPTGETFPFDDPNGGHWRVLAFEGAGHTYWAVAVGPVLHEPTLGVDYNAAFIVDGHAIPDGGPLAFVHSPLPLGSFL